MWPEAVERIAILLRAAGVEGQLEELLPGAEAPPGVRLVATAFDCGARVLVAFVPLTRSLAVDKLERAAGCSPLRLRPVPEFPYGGAEVFVEGTALAAPLVWLDGGTPRHLLGLAPGHFARLTRAGGADLVAETRNGGG